LKTWSPLRVELTERAEKHIKVLGARERAQILETINRFAQTGAGKWKRLQGRSEFSLRSGNYRVLYLVEGESVQVMRVTAIGDRKDVYG
jgi:mRNA-degrading endonuclease RelE of RelBE toxin-antitoxin system